MQENLPYHQVQILLKAPLPSRSFFFPSCGTLANVKYLSKWNICIDYAIQSLHYQERTAEKTDGYFGMFSQYLLC